MKERYSKPSVLLEEFSSVDVMTTSDASSNTEPTTQPSGPGPIELPDL